MSHTATASVASILKESADRFPDEIAVTVGPVSTTYSELWRQTREYAGALRAKGVTEGSRVAMLVPNVADFPGCTTRCSRSEPSLFRSTRS
ncbi:hypothetical protein GCM10025867_17600 [Frondihabitans sucicola]|uniref:AMP-dependent synthetase/ligase domain-containing protein n=1 Tax=Frondihabitans sucicola TaxID=1268041 RepID=A0ABM8GMC3_9MICO|nr:hypothetical protein GCM10025867_17600 [Frondihabitans sucicola]